MKIPIFFLFTMLFAVLQSEAQIVYADYSDPDVCEGTQGDYWLTASSFQCVPGLPILHSNDLIHWNLVNYALPEVPYPQSFLATQPTPLPPQHGKGVWAPSLRKHDDTYYIYWGDPDHGVWMVKTTDPAGCWDDPVLVVPGKGIIDPTPLWDDDGRCYLVNAWAASRCGFNSVLTVRELSHDGTSAIGHPIMIYDGQPDGNHTIEGPKLYKRDGWYYILAPAGGVEDGWQVALRSRSIYGPYESRIMFHRDGLHQGGLVNVADASGRGDRGAFVCFRDQGPYGRVLYLLDVQWRDGWPTMRMPDIVGPKHKSVRLGGDERLRWQWHSNYTDTFGFPTPDGMRIYGYNVSETFRNLWEVPNLYLRKFEGEVFSDTLCLTVTAKTDGQQSGVVVMGRDYCRLSVELRDGQFLLQQIVCTDADQGGMEQATMLCEVPTRRYAAGAKDNYECHVNFVVTCQKGALCCFSYSLDGQSYTPVEQTFQARVGKWIGAKYGIFSIAPHGADKGWVEMTMVQ